MKRFIISIVAIMTIVILSFSACNKSDNSGILDPQQDAIVTIFKNSRIDYWRQIATTINSESEKHGAKSLIFYVESDDDADGQLAIVAGLKELQLYYNIKGVIIAPVFTADDHRVEEALAKFAGNSIPVVIIDSPLDVDASPLKNIYKTYVGTDNTTAGSHFADACGISNLTSILTARIKASVPTVERYQGFCQQMQCTLPVWEATDTETPESFKKELANYPNATNIIFFNGNLCNDVKDAFGDSLNVYTFDVYEQFLLSMKNPATSAIKGIMAQNTFEMGTKAVNAIFSNQVEKNIYINTLFITPDNLYSKEVAPFLNYYGIPKETKSTILMLLGEKCDYWEQVYNGAKLEADKQGINLMYQYGGEADCQDILDMIDRIDTIENLVGIVMAENHMEIDQKLYSKNLNIPIVAIDATPSNESPLKNKFASCVVPDNFNLGKEMASKVPGKTIAIGYEIGGSSDRADGVLVQKGADSVQIFKCMTVEEAVDTFTTFIKNNPSVYESLILTSGNFVTPDLMDAAITEGMNICCVDMNLTIETYLNNGYLMFAAIPNTCKMGEEGIKCILNDAPEYHIHNIPVTYNTGLHL